MALVKGRGWRKRKSAPPPELDSIDSLYQQFLENGGLLRIEQEEDGCYILVRGKSPKGFPLEVYWEGRGKTGSACAHGYGNSQYGPQVMFSPYQGDPFTNQGWSEEAMVHLVIQVLQAGKQLSQMQCGTCVGNGNKLIWARI